ncbi:MAG TPA: hypothetical protein VEZ42_10910 [Pseudonocardia sp.]|nr:hypothetical protein [Pseudonocardia sp.]
MAVGTPTEGRAILSRPLRAPALLVIALAVLVVGVLGERYAGSRCSRSSARA